MNRNNPNKKATGPSFTRRKLIHISSASLFGLMLPGTSSGKTPADNPASKPGLINNYSENTSLIGCYGDRASKLHDSRMPSFSFQRDLSPVEVSYDKGNLIVGARADFPSIWLRHKEINLRLYLLI